MNTATILPQPQKIQRLPVNAQVNVSLHNKDYQAPTTAYTQKFRRWLDISLSFLLAVLLLTWMVPLLFIIIKLTSKGPLFFLQRRVGMNGQVFSCMKFRTMHLNKDHDCRQAGAEDKRVTTIGHFLRVTHIDELPQLINVLKNEMSLVGPRPHMIYHDELFSNAVPGYQYRHLIKPGITGLAQSKGYHGVTPDFISITSRTRFDLFYVQHVSFRLDLQILFLTLFIVPLKSFRKW